MRVAVLLGLALLEGVNGSCAERFPRQDPIRRQTSAFLPALGDLISQARRLGQAPTFQAADTSCNPKLAAFFCRLATWRQRYWIS